MKYPAQTIPKEGSGTLKNPTSTDGPFETPHTTDITQMRKDVPIMESLHVADLSSPVLEIRNVDEENLIGGRDSSSNVTDGMSSSSSSISRNRMRDPEATDRYGDDISLSHFLDGCEDRPQTLGVAGSNCVGYHKGWNRGKNRALKTKGRDKAAAAIPARRSVEAIKVKAISPPDSRSPGGRLSSITEMSKLLATIVRLRIRTLAFCGVRKLVELVLKYCLQDLNSSSSSLHLAELVGSYRGERAIMNCMRPSKLFSAALLMSLLQFVATCIRGIYKGRAQGDRGGFIQRSIVRGHCYLCP